MEQFSLDDAYLEPDFASLPAPRLLIDGHESVSESLDPALRDVIMCPRYRHSLSHVQRDIYVLST